MDVERRSCEVTAVCGVFEVNLSMHFPDNYPNNSAPTFVLHRDTTVDDATQSKLIKVSAFSLFFRQHLRNLCTIMFKVTVYLNHLVCIRLEKKFY